MVVHLIHRDGANIELMRGRERMRYRKWHGLLKKTRDRRHSTLAEYLELKAGNLI
jgi:hypothetical protein